MQPLKGIRVLDASHVVAGPFASYQLCLLGAEVIRIDRIRGEDFVRYHGGTDEMKAAGLGASFVSQNAGKSCIQLNLKDPRGIEIAKKLAATSDVMLENFRPGVMEQLGLGYDAIRAVKEDIIYCSLTGYGHDGPMRDAPAYDHIVQGVSGLMSVTGTEESGPLRMGIPITDYLTGLNGAFAVMSALYNRKVTGEGQHLHVTMLASTLPVLGAAAVEYQTTGEQRALMGNQPFSDSPFAGRFDTRDGQLVVTANTTQQAAGLIATLGITTLEEELSIVRDRGELSAAHKKSARDALTAAFLKDTALAWEDRLSAASVPAGKVRSLSDIVSHPQVAAIGLMDKVASKGMDEKIDVPGLAFKSVGQGARELGAPQQLGESTVDVLSAADFKKDELEALARDGVIAGVGLPTQEG